MKLVRFGERGSERPGCIDADGNIRSLASYLADVTADVLAPEQLDKLRQIDPSSLPIVSSQVRIGPCLANVGKFVCVGLNFSDHAAEIGATPPEEPILFMKPISAIGGPNDDVTLPRGAAKGDWEIELGIIIGTGGKYIEETDAMSHIAGYCLVNDLSERAFQFDRGGQWMKGKSADGFGPIGPWLVTADEIADPHDLAMWLEVNGRRYQNGNTATMIRRIPFLISHISSFMSLAPGDLISTGTPAGVGMGLKPPVYLKAGDIIELGIDGLGTQRQHILADDGGTTTA